MFDDWKITLSILYKYGAVPVPAPAVAVMVAAFTLLLGEQLNSVATALTVNCVGSVIVSFLIPSQPLLEITLTWYSPAAKPVNNGSF